MKFVEYQDIARNRIRACEESRIKINADWVTFPCALSADHLLTNWPTDPVQLTFAQLEKLLATAAADLIIIGRQGKIVWDIDWLKLQATANQRGIGIEQMTIDAAVRTFNVLTTEERPIWLVLLADASAS